MKEEATQDQFVKVNRQLIKNISGKRYIECIGAYCWMKANMIFTDDFEISIGTNRKEILNKNEISYPINFFGKAWRMSDHKVSSLLKEMEELGMIKQVREIDGYSRGKQFVYRINDKLAETDNSFAETTKPFAETTKPFAETTKPFAETTKPFAETTKPFAETTKPFAETDINNYINNNTINNNKKEKSNYPTRDTSFADANVKSKINNDELIEELEKDPLFSNLKRENVEDTVEELDDKQYYNKYGKHKPSDDEDKIRANKIYSQLYYYYSQLKSINKELDKDALRNFKDKCELKPTKEEIIKAYKSIKTLFTSRSKS